MSDERAWRLLTPEAAAWLLRAAVRDANHQLRMNGVRPPAYARQVLETLARVAGHDTPMSGSGPRFANLDSSAEWLPVEQAARAVGRSARHVRRLAQTHQIRARRVGERSWQIDVDSLRQVLQRAHV